MNTEANLETKRKHDEMMENPEALLEEAKQETKEEKEKTIKEDSYYLGELAEKGFNRWYWRICTIQPTISS